MKLVGLLKVLGDETRLRMLALLKDSELCVCELQYTLQTTQSNTSRHLARLSAAGLVVSSKKAQWVSYKLNTSLLTEYPFISSILDREVEKLPHYREDRERIAICREKGVPCEWSS